MSRVEHTLEPIYSKNSRSLILGSMPSIKSREALKYYGNKNNRFWSVLEIVYGEKIIDWKKFIIDNNLALWDVIASCEIDSSKDSSIRNVVVNDIQRIVEESNIQNIFLLGSVAYDLYNKYIYPHTKIEGILLPSPSSANAKFRTSDLVEKYKIIKELT